MWDRYPPEAQTLQEAQDKGSGMFKVEKFDPSSKNPKGFPSPIYFRGAILFDLTLMSLDGLNHHTVSAVFMALFSFIMFRQNKARFGRYW